MSYYKTCPHCGAHLDPGERCDCRPVVSEALRLILGMSEAECAEVLEKIKAAQGAANALDGKVEHANHAVSTSIMNETEVKVK